MIDKYVEFDAVILLLDVLLLRVQSYRHLLFNYQLTSSVRSGLGMWCMWGSELGGGVAAVDAVSGLGMVWVG